MVTEYSLADLTRITGAKRRTVQLWAEGGAIRANPATERAGSGRHRLFSRDEAIVACVVHAFALQQTAIGELVTIGHAVRTWLQGHPNDRELIENVILQGRKATDCYLIFTRWFENRDAAKPRWQARLWEARWSEDEDPFGPLGLFATDKLAEPGAAAMIIRLNTYLPGLR